MVVMLALAAWAFPTLHTPCILSGTVMKDCRVVEVSARVRVKVIFQLLHLGVRFKSKISKLALPTS